MEHHVVGHRAVIPGDEFPAQGADAALEIAQVHVKLRHFDVFHPGPRRVQAGGGLLQGTVLAHQPVLEHGLDRFDPDHVDRHFVEGASDRILVAGDEGIPVGQGHARHRRFYPERNRVKRGKVSVVEAVQVADVVLVLGLQEIVEERGGLLVDAQPVQGYRLAHIVGPVFAFHGRAVLGTAPGQDDLVPGAVGGAVAAVVQRDVLAVLRFQELFLVEALGREVIAHAVRLRGQEVVQDIVEDVLQRFFAAHQVAGHIDEHAVPADEFRLQLAIDFFQVGAILFDQQFLEIA